MLSRVISRVRCSLKIRFIVSVAILMLKVLLYLVVSNSLALDS